ncbi:acyl carrier protein 3, mitochondrial isoform X1 [Diospyros lotus]|uniref:acyl carrier protein 3, mitochondrial isoform X1 n=1 Tax=Diospyros lotus TaxID=55363 RepID=UPI00224D1F14|nr:acyl carrier protein 3, mitochondrial isoform X1 [Diospyros lotus]
MHLPSLLPPRKRIQDCSQTLSTQTLLSTVKMQNIRNSILSYLRVRVCMKDWRFAEDVNPLSRLGRRLCTFTHASQDQVMARVINLVKKFDSIDATKVTETADFQKDLCLDSLDRVELVMALEQEFSVEISDEKADKLTCCADVAEYIVSTADQKITENP